MVKSKFEQWFKLFKKAWEVRVIENEHLMYPCFIEFLAAMNKFVRYIYAGEYKKTHICSIKIQESGTGKGVGDKLVVDCLSRIGCNAVKMNNFTEAGMIGSLKNINPCSKKEYVPQIVKGEIGNRDFIWIDEARNLLVGNRWSQELLTVLNGYLDDGIVYKRLAQGEISYPSSCVIGTGTFYFDLLQESLLRTGFFQRSLITYKNYSTGDVLRISGKYDTLNENDFERDFKPILDEMKILYKSMNWKKYYKEIGKGKYVIKLNSDANQRIGKLIDNYFRENLADCFGNNSLNTIMNSYLIRSKEMAHKVMCLYAIFNEDDEAGENSVDFAFKIVKQHLDSVKNLIIDVFEKDKYVSYNSDIAKARKITKTKNALINLVVRNPGLSYNEIREYIQKHRGEFALGEIATLSNLKELEEEGRLVKEKGYNIKEKTEV